MCAANKSSFWITNISPMNITLADLALNIKSYTTVNLLDKKHYSYTAEQLQKSAESGSLFKKRDKLIIRLIAPEIIKTNIQIQKEAIIPSRERSLYVIKQENYEELNITDDDKRKQDEEFARLNAELEDIDTKKV